MVDMNLLLTTFSSVAIKRFKVLIYNSKLACVNLFALAIRIVCDLKTCKTRTITVTKLVDLDTSYTNNCRHNLEWIKFLVLHNSIFVLIPTKRFQFRFKS